MTEPSEASQPWECYHCGSETPDLTDYSKLFQGEPSWLCRFCAETRSAQVYCAGGPRDRTVCDVASMLNVLVRQLTNREDASDE